MAELALGRGTGLLSRWFFLGMALAMAAVVFFGFGLSYFLPMARGQMPPLAPVIHVHGAFCFGWMVLLVFQAMLVAGGRVSLHRSMGTIGIALGTGMAIFGFLITVLFAGKAAAEPTVYGLTYISLVAVAGFAVLFFLAIRNVRDPAAHRRYILLATTVFLIGAVNRIFGGLFGIFFDSHLTYLPKYLVVDAFIVALAVYDWRTLGRLHRATLVGGLIIVVPQLLHVPIVDSATFGALTQTLGAMARY
jgi:hypothetical protein